jgi:7,8-dihydropterin-6-yl-methyl-4-(beta-D-ribofuranosyl)aminobenzene 5'-phosphate synthase
MGRCTTMTFLVQGAEVQETQGPGPANHPRTPDVGRLGRMAVPQPLERLEVVVLTDNSTDSYSSKPAHVTPEFNNVARAGAHEFSGATLCCAQLGLSLMLTGAVAGRQHKLLFDAGVEGDVLLRNCRNLGVPLDDVEEIAISHGHWDHTGALTSVLDEATRNDRTVPCHVNPDMFVDRAARLSDGRIVPFQPVPSIAELTAHGADVVNDGDERFLLDGFYYYSGEIPRVTTFEKGRLDHLARPNPQEEWQPDPLLMDERYLAVNLSDAGLLVFSACSHAGIVNVLLHARERFPELPLYGVFGGLHLVGSLEAIIPETVAHLKGFGLAQIVPGHCSGFRAVNALLQAFGEVVVVPSAVGSSFSFPPHRVR